MASSGLEDISADLVAPKLSLQRQLMGVDGFASRFAAAQTADARPCAAGTLPVGQGPPPSLQGGARVWHVPRGDARWRVGGPPPSPGHAPPRTGRRVWGPVPRGSSPPLPCKMAAAAVHVTGAPVPPPGGRAGAGPHLPGAPFGLCRAIGPRAGQS